MSNFEFLKKVFSRVDQFWEMTLKCCKREKMGENVVTEAKNSKFIFWNFFCQHILGNG
tara:strand:+ start:549 stop:722 length:174 start_codon:yes stop_codon:yes gene_type:complete